MSTEAPSISAVLKGMKDLLGRSRALLLVAGLFALGLAAVVLSPAVGKTAELNTILIGTAYVLVLGVAAPGLTLSFLSNYTKRQLREGNWIMFSKKVKILLVSVDWAILAGLLYLTLQ
jgi:hypothetical protein